jgi:hypothetical protein
VRRAPSRQATAARSGTRSGTRSVTRRRCQGVRGGCRNLSAAGQALLIEGGLKLWGSTRSRGIWSLHTEAGRMRPDRYGRRPASARTGPRLRYRAHDPESPLRPAEGRQGAQTGSATPAHRAASRRRPPPGRAEGRARHTALGPPADRGKARLRAPCPPGQDHPPQRWIQLVADGHRQPARRPLPGQTRSPVHHDTGPAASQFQQRPLKKSFQP